MPTQPPDSKIDAVTSFLPDIGPLTAKRLPDQPSGVAGELIDAARASPGSMLPPHPDKAPPTTSLAQRMRGALAKGG
jgi:hypothetical protein